MSTPESALAQLSRQLLHSASAALLDLPLDALSEQVTESDVSELLLAIHSAGDALSLRDLIADGQLARWVDETCTPREEHALCAQLRQWLGSGSFGDDDPARLVEIDEAPRSEQALLAWARRHDVLDELARPTHELWPAGEAAPHGTLLACCVGATDEPGRSLLSAAVPVERARALLRERAAFKAALSVREALWRGPPPVAALRLLGERLRGLLSDADPAALHALRFVPARPVSLEPETGVVRGQLRAGLEPAIVGVKLFLSGFEQRALEGACDACATPRCVHERALAGRLLDACLRPSEGLHAELAAFVRVPSWKRFLQAVAADPAGEPGRRERLCFRVRVREEGQLSLSAHLQTVQANGVWSTGKLVSPAKQLRGSQLEDRDRTVLEGMVLANRTLSAQSVPLDLALLRCLVEHPRVELETGGALRIVEHSVQVTLLEQPEGLLPRVTLHGFPLAPGERRRDASFLAHHDPASDCLAFAALTPALRRLLAALAHFRGVLPPESYPLLAPWLSGLRQVAQVSTPKALLGMERPVAHKLLLRILPGLDQGVDIVLSMRPLPLGAAFPPGQGPELIHGLENGVPIYARRDLAWERGCAEQVLDALGARAHLRLDASAYRIETTQAALALLSQAARLGDRLEIEWAETARRLALDGSVRKADLSVRLFKKGHWLQLEGGIRRNGVHIGFGRLLDAARRGERFVLVEGTTYVELERELFERLEQAQLCVLEPLRAPALAPAALPFWLEHLGEVTASDDPAVARWLAQARGAEDAPVSLEPGWDELLRDYQRAGLSWLLRQSRWAPGVCLADEMGLGKTVQAIGLLAARKLLGPGLVIAPTSVASNWVAELERFAPALQVRAYQGKARKELLAELGPSCVIVTSYELLLRDREQFVGLRFATQIVDEAQVIKNARTERARAVASVDAEFRVALSGTPVENRLGDLWSLFRWLAPGLLGSWPSFRARFAVPIERYENAERAGALRALIAPFVLRRTKDEVASELPSRTEVVHMVELSPAEQALYDAAAAEARRAIGRRDRDDAARQLQILAELTRLRQLACHPRLVVDDERAESSKLSALVQLLEDILPRGHRVLLFSQFTRHLALVQQALTALGISSLYMDGSTPAAQRGRVVERFQAGEAAVFLISLKAGGTGLNLTAADYVVHLDPWWNPAAEDQASDRAHRLGQLKPLTIVKLVAQGTIEERVLGLHAHKRRLAEQVLGDAGPAPALDPELIAELLE